MLLSIKPLNMRGGKTCSSNTQLSHRFSGNNQSLRSLNTHFHSVYVDGAINIRRKPPKTSEITTAEKALQVIKSFNTVYLHGQAATPRYLIKKLCERYQELEGVKLVHTHIEGEGYAKPEYSKAFRSNAFFLSGNTRDAVNDGRGDFIPIFLSEIPQLIRQDIIPINVAIISVSPPDAHGYCSFGPTIVEARAAVEVADVIIAQVNKYMPRTFGDGVLHESMIDYLVEQDEPLPCIPRSDPSPVEALIGKNVADFIEDGSTLQMGIGKIPDAALRCLTDRKNLGIHTEMFSDGVVDLVKAGVITGMQKRVVPGKILASFCVGSQDVYDFLDNNPSVTMMDCAFVNNSSVIASNPKVCAINSAIEVDLTGQVCADSIGTKAFSGIGGQMDFIRGASLSKGGKPMIALPSTTNRGESRITPILKPGAGVTTTRAHVHYVITEYGAVNLFGKNLRQRAKALISISHPDHREKLEKAAYERFGNLNVEH